MTSTHRRLGALLLVVGLSSSFPAWADARLEARRHFQNGMADIRHGEYESGISELRIAYAIKPHPSVLYNIARAYQEMGKIPLAVENYRAFLAQNPPEDDAAAVRVTLEKLEAERVPTPTPTPVAPPPTSRRSSAPPPVSSAQSAAEMAQMDALVHRLETAVQRVEQVQQQQKSQTNKASSGADEGAGGAESGDVASTENATRESGEAYEERVETASRYAQSKLDAPNATTIITAEDIRLSGATSIVDLLQRVPGVDLMRLGVGSANVSFRGFNQRVANKVLVLIDGRSEYLDFIGQTEWAALPVDIHEIERIEVIRGPGSALYGADAMLGVINIITRAPGSTPRAEADGMFGTGNTASGSLIGSGRTGDLSYRTSVGYDQADKWSRDYADDRPDVKSVYSDSNLGLRDAHGNLAATYAFSPDVKLTARGGVSRFFTEIYPPGSLPNFYFDGVNAFAQTDLQAGPVALKLFWNHLDAATGPEYSVIGQRSLDSNISSNIFDGELLFSKRFTLGGEHHAQIGVEGRHKQVTWPFIGGTIPELHGAAFIQDEYRPIDALIFTGSYRLDYGPLLNAGKPGTVSSPRLSALWRPTEGTALHASYATAFREATYLENYTGLDVPLAGENGGSIQTSGSRALKPEELIAFELGYRGESARAGLDWDLSLYDNEVSNLIGLSNFTPQGAAGGYNAPTSSYIVATSQFANDPTTYRAQGAELELRYTPVDRLELKGSGAFEHIHALSRPPGGVCAPCSQAPAVKVWGGITYRAPFNLDLSLDASYISSTTWIDRAPSPNDLNNIVVTQSPLAGYFVLNARAAYHFFKDHVTLAVIGSDLAAAHQEHPLGNFINRRVYLTLTVTP